MLEGASCTLPIRPHTSIEQQYTGGRDLARDKLFTSTLGSPEVGQMWSMEGRKSLDDRLAALEARRSRSALL